MEKTGYFSFGETLTVCAAADEALFTDLLRGFTCGRTSLKLLPCTDDRIAVIGEAEPIEPSGGEEYTLTVTERGAAVCGKDHASMLRGLAAFFLRIERENFSDPVRMRVAAQTVRGTFRLSGRFAHLCVFPENTFSELRRLVRLFGMLQYTHLVVEFWGTFPYECFPEYRWAEFSLTKSEVRLLADEGRALGMEIIPMLNHLGHASACRQRSGKHAVLDRYPEFEHRFTPDGWAWNYADENVVRLLQSMRRELCEAFGGAKYFHVGMDEAYIFRRGYVSIENMAAYIGRIVRDVLDEGMIPMLWGDMLVPRSAAGSAGGANSCAPEDEESEVLFSAIDRRAVICDWQYEASQIPVETALNIRDRGYKVVGCCWYKRTNIHAYVETAVEHRLTGAMLTTWHTLRDRFSTVTIFAKQAGLPLSGWMEYATDSTLAATILRCLSLHGSDYTDCGFAPTQLTPTLT